MTTNFTTTRAAAIAHSASHPQAVVWLYQVSATRYEWRTARQDAGLVVGIWRNGETVDLAEAEYER